MTKRILIICIFFCNRSEAQYTWQKITNQDFNRSVNSLFSDSISSKLFVGGSFKFYGTFAYNGVAEWDGSHLNSLGCGLGGCSSVACGGVQQFVRFGNEIYAHFYEDSVGCMNIHHLAKWTGTAWVNLNQEFFYQGSSIGIQNMLNLDSVLLVSGAFDSIQNFKVQGVAKFNGAIWDSMFQCPLFTDYNVNVSPMTNYNGSIYAQNFLLDTNGVRQIFSVWNGQCWEKVPGAFSNLNGSISKMIVYKNELYIAGSFDQNHDFQAPGKSIARWNGVRWDDLNGGVELANSNYSAWINDLAIYQDELYAVGIFQKAGNLPASNIAKWNGSSWCALNNQFDEAINCLAFYHDSLFIGGNFKTIDGDSIMYFAKSAISAFDTCESSIGVVELVKTNIKIYPTPTSTLLTIENNTAPIQKIRITDITGKLILKAEGNSIKHTIDVSKIAAGVYFVEVVCNEKSWWKRFVKE